MNVCEQSLDSSSLRRPRCATGSNAYSVRQILANGRDDIIRRSSRSACSPWRRPRTTEHNRSLVPGESRDSFEGKSKRGDTFDRRARATARGDLSDDRNLDRNGGEGSGRGSDPGRHVVGRRDRHSSGPGQPEGLAGDPGRRPRSGPDSRLLDREQGGEQPLACAHSSPGRGRAAALPLGRRASRAAQEAVSGYQDSIVRPNLPDRTESPDLLGAHGRGRGRQPDDDGANRRPRIDLRHLLSRPSAFIPTFGPGKATCPRADLISGPSSAAWRSAVGSTGSPSERPGNRSRITRASPTC